VTGGTLRLRSRPDLGRQQHKTLAVTVSDMQHAQIPCFCSGRSRNCYSEHLEIRIQLRLLPARTPKLPAFSCAIKALSDSPKTLIQIRLDFAGQAVSVQRRRCRAVGESARGIQTSRYVKHALHRITHFNSNYCCVATADDKGLTDSYCTTYLTSLATYIKR
jgi:hypothetical protein